MDIKLRAKLSAYSKISSIEGVNTTLPLPSVDNVGAVIGVGDSGQYTLFPTIKKENVDEMFVNDDIIETVIKEEIDTLFEGLEEPTTVTKQEIDDLFPDEETESRVEKEDIDTLFNENGGSIGTVSFSEIDSLFN